MWTEVRGVEEADAGIGHGPSTLYTLHLALDTHNLCSYSPVKTFCVSTKKQEVNDRS